MTNKRVDYCSSNFAEVGLDEAFGVGLFVQGRLTISRLQWFVHTTSNDSNDDFLTDAQSLYEEDSESIESIMAKAKQFEYKDDENEN